MKKSIRFSVIFSMMLLVAIGVTAQPSAAFQTVTNTVQRGIVRVGTGIPVTETNPLPIDPKLKCLMAGQKVTVCVLLRPGQYHMYYRENVRGHTQNATMGGFPWVFEPIDTRTKFGGKTKTSKRLCQFLGLDTVQPRDTIVYLEVNVNNLFRPSYQPLPNLPVSLIKSNRYTVASRDNEINTWFDNEVTNNSSPWTRMGYTYDWGPGANTNHTGATEFILKRGSTYKCMDQGGTDNWGGVNRKRYYRVVSDYLK